MSDNSPPAPAGQDLALRVTIRQVAAAANVSDATVSRAQQPESC